MKLLSVCSFYYRKAKDMISRIMNKGHDVMPDVSASDGQSITMEVMIPGNKAGIVIGKGGETIKTLQVRHIRKVNWA